MNLTRSLALLFSGIPSFLCAQSIESPSTARCGHFLVESDMVSYLSDRYTTARDGTWLRSLNYGDFLLSTGLTPSWDVQFGCTGWSRQKCGAPSVEDEIDHLQGDLVLRSKYTLFGVDGESFCLALLPCLHRALAEDLHSGWGLTVPWSTPLPGDFLLAGQFGIDHVDDYRGSLSKLISGGLCLSRQLSTGFSAYVELLSSIPGHAPRVAANSFAPGLVWSPTERFSLDASVILALGRNAPDKAFVLRLSWEL